MVNNMSIQEMLKALLALGLSQQAIALEVGTTQPTISRAIKGADVRHELGKAIERFYAERVMQPRRSAA